MRPARQPTVAPRAGRRRRRRRPGRELRYTGNAWFGGQVDIKIPGIAQTLQDMHALFRSPNVAHGMTALVETDVLGAVGFIDSTAGGLNVMGWTDTAGKHAAQLVGHAVSGPAILLQSWKKSGTTRTPYGQTEAILEISNGDTSGGNLLQIMGDGALYAPKLWGAGSSVAMPGIIISASSPSGSAPGGTFWVKV